MYKIISKKVPSEAITVKPANWPAEVRFVIEINTDIKIGIPAIVACTPKAIDTDKYPKPIGRPSFKPVLKLVTGVFVVIL